MWGRSTWDLSHTLVDVQEVVQSSAAVKGASYLYSYYQSAGEGTTTKTYGIPGTAEHVITYLVFT